MTNYLISLRSSAPDGTPGTDMGSTTYIEIPDTKATYNLITDKTDRDRWLGDISGTAVLVFIHGFGNDATKAVSRHNTIKQHVPSGISLVSFDWPSGNSGFMTYKEDKTNAKLSAPHLIPDCLKFFVNKFGSANVHLFAHSMGAYVTETAFQNAAGATKINHVLMAASDVDRQNYQAGSVLLNNFLSNCIDLTAYGSADDDALKTSEKLPINHGAVPLGLKGFPGAGIPAGCNSIECTGYYQRYVKGTKPPPGEDLSHVWYLLYQPAPPPVNDFYTDMREVLQGLPTAPTRAQRGPRDFTLQRPPA
ncbi:alpha/beta hydrolase [Reyranella soli]|uniref:Alpha/beta hydrolase n=1 Tax=Reyranella soli TaxID=1230389 RepID=A0A512N3G4_9HYPH|nr:alpha/beta hydrolase [Reyranella soli]GEP53483.1 hypothetical protein RSO01_06490 [Reyranella soli]